MLRLGFKEVSGDEKASVLVETALVLPVLSFVLLAGISFSVGLYRALAIENALGRAARFAIINVDGPDRIEAIKEYIVELGEGYGSAVRAEDIRVCLADDIQCRDSVPGSNENAGGPESFVAIVVRTHVDVLYKLGFWYRFEVVARNEPA